MMKRTSKHGESWGGLFRVAIVGAASLKGKEVKDVLTDRGFPSNDVKLLDEEESLGQMEAVGDEPTFVQNVLPEHMEGVDFAFYAADEAFTQKTWKMARDAGSEIIDLSFALEKEPGTVLRSPWVEQEFAKPYKVELRSAPVVVAHPVASILALLISRAKKVSEIRSAIVSVFEPASEYGKTGMDELHDQTVNLLSFQQLPMAVFGLQVAFNLGAVYGQGAQADLGKTESRIIDHYRRITEGKLPVPSVMLLHAPVFHAHTFSIYIDLATEVPKEELEAALSGEHVALAHGPEEEPSNVNVAGLDEVQVTVRADKQRPTGYWIWAAADNLRIGADMGVACAEDLVATRPRGKVQ